MGVSAQAVLVNPAVLSASTGCTAIIAPFVGSTEPVSAQIWVSLSDASGAPLPIPSSVDGGAKGLEGFVAVALLPNALPSSTPVPSYPLALTSAAPTTLAGRQWGLLALTSPVAIPEGGWFAITLMNGSNGLYLAAPDVVPTAAGQIVPGRSVVAPTRPISEIERGAILEYGRRLPRHRPPRKRTRPRL
jgi:hypothetical protein